MAKTKYGNLDLVKLLILLDKKKVAYTCALNDIPTATQLKQEIVDIKQEINTRFDLQKVEDNYNQFYNHFNQVNLERLKRGVKNGHGSRNRKENFAQSESGM